LLLNLPETTRDRAVWELKDKSIESYVLNSDGTVDDPSRFLSQDYIDKFLGSLYNKGKLGGLTYFVIKNI
jgi:hypothetical protein